MEPRDDPGQTETKGGSPPVVACALCGRAVERHSSYVVRIDVFADPSVPPMSTEELEASDFGQSLSDLMQQMDGMTADDLQDDVHRRFEFRVCRPCQRLVLANPLGMPRRERAGTN